jgi:hypothetical protein
MCLKDKYKKNLKQKKTIFKRHNDITESLMKDDIQFFRLKENS